MHGVNQLPRPDHPLEPAPFGGPGRPDPGAKRAGGAAESAVWTAGAAEGLAGLLHVLDIGLERVRDRFDAELASDLTPVVELVTHVERYRGKMLRPTLAITSALAVGEHAGGISERITALNGSAGSLVSDDVVILAAVCEMVHMATLVHDDVLDDADLRRRGQTINSLRGNEAAVILGDYLIAGAYHLCSQIQEPAVARAASLEIGRVSMELASGELLQIAHRGDFDLDESTYFRILEGKTASLIGASASLAAMLEGARAAEREALARFGHGVGLAFQIRDDVLDLTGDEETVGKSVAKDLETGKLTLPLIHHLRVADSASRASSLDLLREASCSTEAAERCAPAIRRAAVETGSLDYAAEVARRLIGQSIDELGVLPDGPARELLVRMAAAVLGRSR